MDRMRAGLTGLGLVFVATLGASVLFGASAPEQPKSPEEPLAQLGVAPGQDRMPNATAPAETAAPRLVVPPASPPDGDPPPGTAPTTEDARLLPDAARSAVEREGAARAI